MTITLDHTIVVTRDKKATAKFYIEVLGLPRYKIAGWNDPYSEHKNRLDPEFKMVQADQYSVQTVDRIGLKIINIAIY